MKIILSSKRNHYLSRISIFLIIVALIAGIVGCNGNGYTPPPSQDLEIRTWYDLDDIRDNLGGNHTLMHDLNSTTSGYTELASDAADGGKGWQPIGTYDEPFAGRFDGQGHEICDMFINRPNETNVGLFGKTYEGGAIEDIGVVNATVSAGDQHVGALVGLNEGGTVSNSYSTGSVTGPDDVGGLVGWNTGAVSNSYSTCNVTGGNDVGGLVGDNWGTVSNSYASGNVSGDTWSCGGLVGCGGDAVSNSFWDMETSGQSNSDAGTGKTTAEMQDIATFNDTETEGLDEPWDITAVTPGSTNTTYTWNIVNNVTYPFLSWEPVS